MHLFKLIGRALERLLKIVQPKFHKPTLEAGYGYLKFTFKEGYGLSYKTEDGAIKKYNKLLNRFVQKNNRYPTKSEVGRIIINASHITIRYHRGKSGHWGRQKVRQYLFNLHGIKYNKQ